MASLHLFRGIPGSSKTTASLSMFPNIPHFENDQFFYSGSKYNYDKRKMPQAIEWCISNVENCLKNDIDVSVANTFTKRKFVESYKRLAEKYNSHFTVYRMMGNFQNIHHVPENILRNMKDNFEDYEGETFVYPNINQSEDDPCYRPYMFTELNVGDKIELLYAVCDMMPIPPPKYAVVSKICQGTYDYLNVFYKEIESGKEGICMTGNCKKVRL